VCAGLAVGRVASTEADLSCEVVKETSNDII
jgi:hypothetical protein